jgi:hypothetical protein
MGVMHFIQPSTTWYNIFGQARTPIYLGGRPKGSNSHSLAFGMITWGVGTIHLNVPTKLEHNEDLALVIQMI